MNTGTATHILAMFGPYNLGKCVHRIVLFDCGIFIIDHRKKSKRSFRSIINYNRNSEAVSALQDFVIDTMDIT